MYQPQRLIRALQDNIGKAIVGKEDVVELILIALLCRGHVLIEDVPGVGKTTLATALARSLDCSFKRIQFTPDVTPSDVTGFTLANFKTGEMEWRPGAVMSQIVLADEINRTSPKTQSSLLEVMEEYQVTVDGVTHPLPRPFIVLATQNPIEFVGTYPLPEAQMDRFFMRISIGYPTLDDEIDILDRYTSASAPMQTLEPVCTAEDILLMQTEVANVYTAKEARSYIAQLALATRRHAMLKLGASTRGAISLTRAAQAFAFLSGRNYIIPEDVQRMARPVLSHRITLSPEARMKNVLPERIIDSVLAQTQVPVKVQ
ncbi:MAG: MoxR family ATPase [Oscillospiraceae bacterium]|nr:MoxR family ATPase [Oscillospiraceae bacterium]